MSEPTKGQVAGIDYLSGMIPVVDVREFDPRETLPTVRGWLQDAFGAPDETKSPWGGYDARENYGPQLDLLTSGTRNRSYLQIKGSAFDRMSSDLVMGLSVLLGSVNFTATRVDARVDDWDKLITVENLWLDYVQQGRWGGFKAKMIMGDRYDPEQKTGGYTLYLGDRGENSQCFARIYDKFAQSKGEVDTVRWETQYRREKSVAVFRGLLKCETEKQFASYVGGAAVGRLDFFVDPSGDKNLSRRQRPGWWLKFLERLRKGPRLGPAG